MFGRNSGSNVLVAVRLFSRAASSTLAVSVVVTPSASASLTAADADRHDNGEDDEILRADATDGNGFYCDVRLSVFALRHDGYERISERRCLPRVF